MKTVYIRTRNESAISGITYSYEEFNSLTDAQNAYWSWVEERAHSEISGHLESIANYHRTHAIVDSKKQDAQLLPKE